MTGSPLLDLFLSMAMFFFAMCMICSSANDAVARVFKWRAKTLQDGIRSLLLNATAKRKLPDGKVAEVELTDLFFNHPFVQTLRLQAELGDTWLSRNLEGLTGRLMNAWRALVGGVKPNAKDPQLDPTTKLTFIPTNAFVHTLCEILKPDGWGENEPLTFAALWRAIDQLPDDTAGPLKVVLKSVANDPAQDLDALRTRLARWFDDGMEQASVWFRQRMQTSSLIVGAILTLGLNVDAIEIGNRFYGDANLRAQYVEAAMHPVPAAGSKPSVDPIKDFNFKPGWGTNDPEVIWEQLQHWMKVAGLAITIVALAMGAPFWHDAITRLVSVKSDRKAGQKGS